MVGVMRGPVAVLLSEEELAGVIEEWGRGCF